MLESTQPYSSSVSLNINFQGLEDEFNEKVAQFTNFLDRDFKQNADHENIKLMVQRSEKRLVIDIDELRTFDPELCENLLKHPVDYLPAFEKALKDIVLSTYHPSRAHSMQEHLYYIGFQGAFGSHHVNPRSLNASYLGKLIALEGIVTRCSLVRPKMVKSVHYCEKTQLFHTREYRDATMIGDAIPTGTAYPTEDENGNALTTEFGYSTFLDHQLISIQEMPERAPPGQLPRSIDIILGDDLVDSCKPGDRVHFVGVYRSVGGSQNTAGTFRTFLVCQSLQLLDQSIAQPILTEYDLQHIKKLSQRSSIVEVLAQSLAPSIFGHPHIKKAILLLLLGGLERNLENGTHLRGDINILLLGDPSTAKSQFLRLVLQMAPLAIATTGRGSSGVGLTAAVTTDKETGDRRLEAGAMVLADRGIVCIDEFDKMSDTDRVAIHEVMEQQTITIAKAGIHTSLNARCSVFAAANPTYGQYDESLEPHRNIRLPDSLLSRFDLLFIVLDKTDEAMDRQLSTHVLQMHRYLPPGAEEGKPLYAPVLDPFTRYLNDHDLPTDTLDAELHTTSDPSPFLTPASTATGSFSKVFSKTGRKRKEDLLALPFLKKYIHYAKTRIKPVLTEEASQVIVEEYASLRNEKLQESNSRRTLPITARTLETLIRLSTAHAKARLSPRVEDVDAEVAGELLRFALFKEYHKKKRRRSKKPKHSAGASSGTTGSDSSSGNEEGPADVAMEQSLGSLPPLSSSVPNATPNRYGLFKQKLDTVFQELGEVHVQQVPLLVNQVHSESYSGTPHDFSQVDCDSFLQQLEAEIGVYIDKETGMVYRM